MSSRTHGTSECNFSRSGGILLVDDRDEGNILISEGPARSYVCGATSWEGSLNGSLLPLMPGGIESGKLGIEGERRVWQMVIEHFNQHGFECLHTGENYPTCDGVVDSERTRWSQEAVNDDAVAMGGHSGKYYPTRDVSFLDTDQGILICDIELGRSHFTCEETDEILA